MLVVPALAVAGFVSAIYTGSYMWRLLSVGTTNQYPYAVFAGLSLGLTFAAVLGRLGFISRWWTALAIVAATVGVHAGYVFFLERRFLLPLMRGVGVRLIDTTGLYGLTTYALVALLLYTAVLLMLVQGPRKIWTTLIAPGCAGAAALTVAWVESTFDSLRLFLNGAMLGTLWQTVLGLFLGLALALARPRVNVAASGRVLAYVLAAFFVTFGTWSSLALERKLKRLDEASARRQAEIDTIVAQAPSRDSLPAIEPVRMESALLMDGVGTWRPYASWSHDLPAEEQKTKSAPRPRRIVYTALYSRTSVDPADTRSVHVDVTYHPNAAWATYDVTSQAFGRGSSRVSKFGHTFYDSAPYYSWASGDKVILLTCQMVLEPVVDEFLQAYLRKYPSSL